MRLRIFHYRMSVHHDVCNEAEFYILMIQFKIVSFKSNFCSYCI